MMQAQTSVRKPDTSTTLFLVCSPSAASDHRSIFTGKERDAESGNDYFGARYYASTLGRFLSPDWSAKAEPVPYAKLDDPQTLNLYSYVRNNPLSGVDPDGHAFGVDDLIGVLAGGAVGAGVEVVKDLATGQRITTGGVVGAAVGGALFGEGIVNAPETLGGSVVLAAAAKGAVQGAISNAVQQGVDIATGEQKSFSGKSLAISTAAGALTEGIASKVPLTKIPGISSGRGNMKAVAQAIRTKMANGTVNGMSLTTAVKGAVGGQVANAGKTFAGAAADVAAKKTCNAAASGGCN
jgi:RHS repeat-associated protein